MKQKHKLIIYFVGLMPLVMFTGVVPTVGAIEAETYYWDYSFIAVDQAAISRESKLASPYYRFVDAVDIDYNNKKACFDYQVIDPFDPYGNWLNWGECHRWRDNHQNDFLIASALWLLSVGLRQGDYTISSPPPVPSGGGGPCNPDSAVPCLDP